jgi:YesN/AraC family two-component response regulator
MIRLIICDDQEVVCQGLKAILSTAENLEVLGIANNGAEAIDLVESHPVDVVLMDLKMPIMNGIHATKAIKEKHPGIKVLVLTTYDADACCLMPSATEQMDTCLKTHHGKRSSRH